MKHPWRVLPALLLTAVTVSATTAPSNADVDPTLTVTEVVSGGLDIPWDMAFLPDGSMLYTERSRRLVHLRTPGGVDTVVINTATADAAGVWASGETGMMGIEVAADFSTTGDFITCHGYRREASGTTTQDVRVVRWKLNTAHTSARFVRTLVYTLPSTSGRHGGCALEKGASNSVYVGTGDAATGTNPQNVYSGGGKVLRVNATTGKGMSNNPFHASVRYIAQRIFTYGHRNVQGLARRADGRIWSIEQGSYRDDEVNLLSARGNYGWNPVPRAAGDPSYNEGANSPMTDNTLPGTQLSAKWRSGTQTEA
ncbi:MAG: PQQ-dependent sugar dehydrogenase, partial [Aeromicrobium sp.]